MLTIKKISNIKNFGSFIDFEWQENFNEFKKYNFFYGWNYSGKTTLSRIFKCLEDKKIHPDFSEASFILETDNGNITQKDIGKDFAVRVFNEEFIEENFKWNDESHEIQPVLLLGKEPIELENKIAELTKEKGEKEKEFKDVSERKKSQERQLELSLTEKASGIRDVLNITNPKDFDKNTLEKKINELSQDYKNFILSDNQYQQSRDLIITKTKYEKVDEIRIQLNLNKFINEVKSILDRKITAQQIIQKLKDNPELATWVRKGIDLHKNEELCQFCGNKLPLNLFDKLNKHFSREFDQLIKEINDKENEISNHKNQIEKTQTPDKARFFPDYQEQYQEKQKSLKIELNNYMKSLEVLINKLKQKKEKPFDMLDFGNTKDINSIQKKIERIVKKINTIIENNNQKIENLENEKKEAREKIINHIVAKSIDEIKYFDKKQSIYDLNKNINEINKKINEISEEIIKINNQINAEAIGVEKINTYLKQFFNDDRLKLELLDSRKYRIYRDNVVAKNLSTGEKNMIALIYFFVRLEERGFNLNKSIVFIDDPVSSLDCNHTFKVYSFLNEKLKDCGKLFITTHNFDFFNLLKDLNKYDLGNEGVFYLIKKISANGKKKSIIENLPVVLSKFKSEYNYLFSILKNFNEAGDKSNFELLYLIPNIARRFLESYLFMRYPDGNKFDSKCEVFFKNENSSNKQCTLKLLNEYSHEQNPEHSQKFPDVNEVEISVKFILETIANKDKEHYDCLCNSCSTKNNI